MKCFYCDEDIAKITVQNEDGTQSTSTDVKFIPLDIPYVNLPFHRSTCYANVMGEGEEKYLRENLNRMIDFMDGMDILKLKSGLKPKSRRKTKKQ